MSHIAVSDLAYAHPGGALLFSEVSFGVKPGAKAALVGDNGVGKTTMFSILAGEVEPIDGAATVGGTMAYMRQDVGLDESITVRQLLLACSDKPVREAGGAMVAAEARVAAQPDDPDASMALADAIADWGEVDGYRVESEWDAVLRRVVRQGFEELGPEPSGRLSGGERKQVVLDLLFHSDFDVLLLDEPDNFLDIPAKRWLEQLIATTTKTVFLISHDRQLLAEAVNQIVTLETNDAWVHGGSYTTYAAARDARQRQLGDALDRWKAEERRLFRFYKTMKQRAGISEALASRADAAESRWQRFVDAGPPPPPAPEQTVRVRLPGAESGKRVITMADVELADLTFPFTAEVYYGERVGLVGPNGSGKTHLLQAIMGHNSRYQGRLALGARVEAGLFTQTNQRPELMARTAIEPVNDRLGNRERAMKALASYGLAAHADQAFRTLSGGQKARLEILLLELDGANLLLLDEPTDNLDFESAESLERALDGFAGTLVAVSHDRVFLSRLDRFWLLDHSGFLYDLPDWETAQAAVDAPDRVSDLRHARLLTTA